MIPNPQFELSQRWVTMGHQNGKSMRAHELFTEAISLPYYYPLVNGVYCHSFRTHVLSAWELPVPEYEPLEPTTRWSREVYRTEMNRNFNGIIFSSGGDWTGLKYSQGEVVQIMTDKFSDSITATYSTTLSYVGRHSRRKNGKRSYSSTSWPT